MTIAARVHVDVRHLTQSRVSGLVSGKIWLRVGETDFPANDWNDFPVPVLASLALAAGRLLRAESTEERVYFMDGPFEVELGALSPHRWQIRLLKRGLEGRPVLVEVVDPATIVDSIRAASTELLNAVDARHLATDDIRDLRRANVQLALPRP